MKYFNKTVSAPDQFIHFQVADVEVERSRLPIKLTTVSPPLQLQVRASSHPRSKFLSSRHNPLLLAAYIAFSEHRILELCPDAIWLTIISGLAQHIEKDPEAHRAELVPFPGKMSLVVDVDPQPNWPEAVKEFSKKVSRMANPDVVDWFLCDFTTTDLHARVASQVVLMSSMKAFFDYEVKTKCGIPEIRLLGAPEDWEKIRDKTKDLGKFGLERWAQALEPVLDHFIAASKGDVDTDFWNSLYTEYDCVEREFIGYGRYRDIPRKYVTGWVGLFFPYTQNGNANYLIERSLLNDKSLSSVIRYRRQDWLDCLRSDGSMPQEYHGLSTDPEEVIFCGLEISAFPRGLSRAPFSYDRKPFEFNGGLLGAVYKGKEASIRPIPGWVVGKRKVPKQTLADLFAR